MYLSLAIPSSLIPFQIASLSLFLVVSEVIKDILETGTMLELNPIRRQYSIV